MQQEPGEEVAHQLMRVLWALLERAGGTVTIPIRECAAKCGAFHCAWDEETGITVSIAEGHTGNKQ